MTMKWAASIALIIVYGCSAKPIYKDEIRKYMLPGIEDSYEITKVFEGDVYSYHKAVSNEPIHTDVIYFASGSDEIVLLDYKNIWEVVSKDEYGFDEVSSEIAFYIFEIEFPKFEMIGTKRLWEENPFYCDKLNEVEYGDDSTIFASIFNEFIRVEYSIVDEHINKLTSYYECKDVQRQ